MPGEWEAHAATWLSFPHNPDSWPGKLPAAQKAYAKMIAALAQSEPLHINVNDDEHEELAKRLLDEVRAGGEIHFHRFPTNDAWCRDHGAIFLVGSPPCQGGVRGGSSNAKLNNDSKNLPQPLLGKEGSRLALNWQYNAWGEKYPPFDLDNAIPPQMAEYLGIPCQTIDMVLEGGSIDVNGEGLLLTTESCLLNKNRNPHLSREQIEHHLREMLGVEKILWLGDGIIGDDTDGHIDDLTRFVAPNRVVTVIEENPADENYAPLQENLVRLEGMTNLQGEPLDIIELPMPAPVIHEGHRLPASYANFYIANSLVLLPTYRCAADQQAIDILGPLFPNRKIVGVDCTDLVWGLGACHCLTQQVPA
mgnify:FL=1